MSADLDTLREQLEEEQEGRSDLQRLLTKSNNEISVWRQKLESGEGGCRSEELDDLKRKMGAKIADAESQLEAALAKASSLEKVKHRMAGELEDVMIEVERAQSIANQADKRQRQFDKAIDEWKRKCTDMQSEVENSQRESRANAAEVYKLRSQIEESHDTIEALR